MYGPHQYPEKLIPKFINQLMRGKKLTIHGNGTYPSHFSLYLNGRQKHTAVMREDRPRGRSLWCLVNPRLTWPDRPGIESNETSESVLGLLKAVSGTDLVWVIVSDLFPRAFARPRLSCLGAPPPPGATVIRRPKSRPHRCRRKHEKFSPRCRRRARVRDHPPRRGGRTHLQHRGHERVFGAASRQGSHEARRRDGSTAVPLSLRSCRPCLVWMRRISARVSFCCSALSSAANQSMPGVYTCSNVSYVCKDENYCIDGCGGLSVTLCGRTQKITPPNVFFPPGFLRWVPPTATKRQSLGTTGFSTISGTPSTATSFTRSDGPRYSFASVQCTEPPTLIPRIG